MQCPVLLTTEAGYFKVLLSDLGLAYFIGKFYRHFNMQTMNFIKWSIQILLVIAFAGSGIVKLITPYQEMVNDPNMGWAVEFTATQIKIIAVLEILGSIGLFLPYIVKKFRFFVPLAAIGLAATMTGAAFLHLTRGEFGATIPNLILFVMAILTAFWRKDLIRS
jgi:hypothetical protein